MTDDLRQLVTQAGRPWEEFDRLRGPARMDAALRTGAALARREPGWAWQSVAALPLSDDREFLARGVLLEWADRAPLDAVEQLKLLPEDRDRVTLARLFFERWGATHAPDAAESVSRFPAGPTRDAAMDAVLVKWTASGPAAAARWASRLPWTRTVPEPLPVIGMAGTSTLKDVHYDRGDAMQLVAFEWAKTDPQAALQWAQSASDPALKTLLLKLIRH